MGCSVMGNPVALTFILIVYFTTISGKLPHIQFQILVAVLFFSWHSPSHGVARTQLSNWTCLEGKLHNGDAFITYSADDDYRCKRFDFDPSSKATDNVHVQLRLRLSAYNVALSWIESVSKVGWVWRIKCTKKMNYENHGVTAAFTPPAL